MIIVIRNSGIELSQDGGISFSGISSGLPGHSITDVAFDPNNARDHYNGGGHDNAAGGRSEVPIEETTEKFINLLQNYTTELKLSDEKK